ncbi:MAG: XrtA/PEP-CTERM system TPR-repeat protein PrsT [Pseudomonadota bacterium]
MKNDITRWTGLLLAAAVLLGCGQQSTESLLGSAKTYLANDDTRAAVIQLKNALQQDPESAEARFLLGSALLKNGEVVAAGVELRKALALKHPQDAVVPALARSMVMAGEHKKLTEEFGATQLTDRTATADLRTSLSNAYAGQGKVEQAEQSLAAALEAVPEYAPARIAEARLKAVRRDVEGAARLVDAVLATSPNEADAWQLKGDLLMFGDSPKPAEAIAAYRKALALKPDALLAHSGAMSTLLRGKDLDAAKTQLDVMKQALPRHPRTKYFEALYALRRDDFKTAKEQIDEVLRIAPESIEALQLAGVIEYRNKSLLQAEKHLSKALALAPGMTATRMLLAETYVRTGQPMKAIEVAEPALAGGKADANTYALVAQAYMQTGNPQKAEALFAQAAKVDPGHVRSRTALALGQLGKGQTETGMSELRAVASADPSGFADLALINAQMRRRDYDAALKSIDALERKQADKPLAANVRGTVHLARKDEAAARRSFERALEIDPVYYPAVAQLAALDLAAKQPDAARKRFERVLAVDPRHPQALVALAAVESRSGAAPTVVAERLATAIKLNREDVTPRLLLVDHYLKQKDFRAAITTAQDGVTALPQSADMLDALGRAQMASGEVNQAHSTFNGLIRLEPQSPRPHIRLADLSVVAKNNDAAIQSLKRALATAPMLLAVQRSLIVLYAQSGQPAEARAVIRNIQKQRPKQAVGHVLEGDLEATQKNWAAAASAYRTALKNPGTDDVAPKLHATLVAAGQRAEADAFAANWVKEHPKELGFQFYLGEQALSRKEFPAAEARYLAIVRSDPDNAPALNNLAWVTAKLGKPGALAYAEKANALKPNEPPYMDTLAMLLAEADQAAKAVELQKKALALQPDNPALRLNLAKIYIKSGDKVLAKDELEKLAKGTQKFAGQAEVGELLKTL